MQDSRRTAHELRVLDMRLDVNSPQRRVHVGTRAILKYAESVPLDVQSRRQVVSAMDPQRELDVRLYSEQQHASSVSVACDDSGGGHWRSRSKLTSHHTRPIHANVDS